MFFVLYSTLILGMFPLHQIVHVGVNVSRDLKLFGREIIFEVFQTMWSRYLNVTDGRTVSQTTYSLITALCAALCGKKRSIFINKTTVTPVIL